ncbi:MAG: uroporphyrinogen decarboxylase family protein [Bacillota bacterium]|nr:uroporphyrinogen decarboxylase family protein [Bacillota bacterium]
MDIFTPKERLLRVLHREKVDRPPVICPGGMMNAAIVDVMNITKHTLPTAHSDYRLMSELSKDVYQYTGFENFGIPFCMTVEAELLGSKVDFGTLSCEPKIIEEVFPSVTKVEYKNIKELLKDGRVNTVIQAGHYISKSNSDVPVIGNLTGPISTAASLVDAMTFLKELRKCKEASHRVIDYVTDFLIEYAKLMIENGVTVISIADPTATGEILGPKTFQEYAVKYINKLIDGIHAFHVPVIVHICGNLNAVKNQLPNIKSDAISTDSLVNLRMLKEEYPSLITMGNLSTYLLEFGDSVSVSKQTEKLLMDGINIISPACGLSTSSSLRNINAFTNTVKEGQII